MIKTEEILIRGPKNKETICDIFSYEPENIEEASLGGLYMVAEMTANSNSFHLINLLSSLIKREYYSLPHRGPTESLEAGLKKANSTLSDVANQGNLSWLGKLHFICAAIKEKDIFLTQTGSAQAHLCRDGELISITKKIILSTEKPHPAKTFQSVISGKIETSDKIIFGTPSIFDFFSSSGLAQLFTLSKIEQIADQMNKVLREQKRPGPLSALLLEIVDEEIPAQGARQKKDFITPPILLGEIIK